MPLVPQGLEIPCASDGLAPPRKFVLELDDVHLGKVVTCVGLRRTVADLVLEVVLLVLDVEVVLLGCGVEDDLILVKEVVALVRGVTVATIVDLATVDILLDVVLAVTLALN